MQTGRDRRTIKTNVEEKCGQTLPALVASNEHGLIVIERIVKGVVVADLVNKKRGRDDRPFGAINSIHLFIDLEVGRV